MRLVIASSVYRIVVGETNSTLVSPLMQNARVQVPPDARRGCITSASDSRIFPFPACRQVDDRRCGAAIITGFAIIFLFVYTKGRLAHVPVLLAGHTPSWPLVIAWKCVARALHRIIKSPLPVVVAVVIIRAPTSALDLQYSRIIESIVGEGPRPLGRKIPTVLSAEDAA